MGHLTSPRTLTKHLLISTMSLLLIQSAKADEGSWFTPPARGSQRQKSSQLLGEHGNEERSYGTLFQWSDGPSFSGGPNLDEPLVTDRPDFTEASTTVGRGVTQIEFGYTYIENNDNGGHHRGHSLGEPLLRHGIIADWLELRVGLSPLGELTNVAGASDSSSGMNDLYLGLKLGLTPQEGLLPEMALIPQMFVPTGSSEFTAGQVNPGVNWIYAWEINDFLSTAGSTQGNRSLDDHDKSFLEIAQSWTVAYSLSDKLGAYTEWFGLFHSGSTVAQVEHYFNGGFTYLLSNDIQFDIRAGMGLNQPADDFFAGTGLSIRFR